MRDLLLEAEEVRLWYEEAARRAGAEPPEPDDPESGLWESAQHAAAPAGSGDALADYWEAELAAGRTPDLNMR